MNTRVPDTGKIVSGTYYFCPAARYNIMIEYYYKSSYTNTPDASGSSDMDSRPYPYSFPDPSGVPDVSPRCPAWLGISPIEEFAELPEGLAMAFAQDTLALKRFTALPVEAQDDVIRRARTVSTRDEMRRLIGEI